MRMLSAINSPVSHYIRIHERKIRRGCVRHRSPRVHPLRPLLPGTYSPPNPEKKVLHIDRSSFYGGEGASVNLTNLWKIFKPEQEPPAELGHNRDWNIDLIPKYIMSGGKLVKILLKTRVSRYLEWKRNKPITQPSTAPTSSRARKAASSARAASRSPKSQ